MEKKDGGPAFPMKVALMDAGKDCNGCGKNHYNTGGRFYKKKGPGDEPGLNGGQMSRRSYSLLK